MKKLLTMAIVLILSNVAVRAYAQTTSTFSIYGAAYYCDSVRIVPGGSSGTQVTLTPSQLMQPITIENGAYTLEFYFTNSSASGQVRTDVTSDWYPPSSSETSADPYTRVAYVQAYFGTGFYYTFTAH